MKKKQLVMYKNPTMVQAKKIGDALRVNWNKVDLKEFRKGLKVEQEHGGNSKTNVTGNDPVKTGKITLAHLNEMKDYYTKLSKMEKKK